MITKLMNYNYWK